MAWVNCTGKGVDYLADDDLERAGTGDRLRGAYDLVVFPGHQEYVVVFPGHQEYVTARAYDVLERYRDLGGNLMFLAALAPWLFEGTGLTAGSAFGRYRIEIDARTRASPPGTRVLARIADLMGPGRSAEMTYYETRAGARVFCAGAINFVASMTDPRVERLVENAWRHLAP